MCDQLQLSRKNQMFLKQLYLLHCMRGLAIAFFNESEVSDLFSSINIVKIFTFKHITNVDIFVDFFFAKLKIILFSLLT